MRIFVEEDDATAARRKEPRDRPKLGHGTFATSCRTGEQRTAGLGDGRHERPIEVRRVSRQEYGRVRGKNAILLA
jgi:hypothetical protein